MGPWSKAPGDREGRQTVLRKVMLTVIVAATIVIMSAALLTVLSPGGARISLWFVFPAICAMSACYLASGLVSALTTGKVSDSLHTGIQVLTLALLLGLPTNTQVVMDVSSYQGNQ